METIIITTTTDIIQSIMVEIQTASIGIHTIIDIHTMIILTMVQDMMTIAIVIDIQTKNMSKTAWNWSAGIALKMRI